MSDNRHLIWSNYDLDYEDWKDELEAEYPEKTEYHNEMFPNEALRIAQKNLKAKDHEAR